MASAERHIGFDCAVDGWTAKAEGHPAEGLKQMSEAAELDDAREKSIAMENNLLPMHELLGEYPLEIGRPVPGRFEITRDFRSSELSRNDERSCNHATPTTGNNGGP